MNFIKFFAGGRISSDIELKALPSGDPIAKFSMAINKVYYKDKQKVEEVSFLNITAFNKVADLIAKYLKKGSGIFIEGHIKQNRWTDEAGNKKSAINFIADRAEFLDSKPKEETPKPAAKESADESGYQPDPGEPF